MLTKTQLATFKAAIAADANVAADLAAGNLGAIAAYYNGASATQVWLPAIPVSVMNTAIVWSAFMALSVQAQNAYFALTANGVVDATSGNVRAGFASIFGAGTTLTNLTAIAQRIATIFENLFAVSNVTPLFGYQVTPADVALALAS